jgi:hypothetical protein
MMRKRLFMIAGILVSVAWIVYITLAILPPWPGVTKENFDRIRDGMTSDDVVAILGNSGMTDIPFEWPNNPHMVTYWVNPDRANVTILFEHGLVISKTWHDPMEDENGFDRFRRRIHWPWW